MSVTVRILQRFKVCHEKEFLAPEQLYAQHSRFIEEVRIEYNESWTDEISD